MALATACASSNDAEGSKKVVRLWRQTFGVGESLELSTAHVTALCNAGEVQEAEMYFHDFLDNRRHPVRFV